MDLPVVVIDKREPHIYTGDGIWVEQPFDVTEAFTTAPNLSLLFGLAY